MDDRRKILERFWDRIVCQDLDWPDEEIRRRVRVMRLGGLALSGFGLLFALEFLHIGQWLLGSVVASAWFGLIFLWSMVRRGKHLRVLAHIMLAIMWSGVVFALWMTGGLSLANDVALFTIPPFALFMIGRSGVVWALASLGALLGMHALDASGYRFPQYLASEDLASDMVMTWLTSMLVTIAILFIYESARGRSLKILEEAKERAESANLAKGRFLAKMSHEFRTPLNAIIGLSEVLQGEQLDADKKQDLRSIKSSAYALLHLVEDVLDLAAIEAGRLRFHPEPFRPEAIAAELVDGLRKRAAGKGLELRSELHELPTRMMGDPMRFRQILLNLLDNALKFTDAGWVSIKMALEQDGDQSWLKVLVEDTGIGIEAADAKRVFESFGQVENGGQQLIKGTGLGLAITAELVEGMGGRISLDSHAGKGSRFELWLPSTPVPPRVEGRRILAVEDDLIGRRLLETILSKAGLDTDLVADGEAALRIFDAERHVLILMDLCLPGQDGLEVTRQIRAREREMEGARVIILALTANALEEERLRCMDAGMDGFITKPIEPAELMRTLESWLVQDEGRDGNLAESSV